MKIIALQAENIKKLVAVEIKPDGNIVQITGKNGQGKTSILDCIWWALAGSANIQAVPIRNGENTAKIRLDMGEVVVTRTFRKNKDGESTSAIVVENDKGARFPSPQTMLDKLLGAMSFDPLAFARMDRRGQFETLRKFVPGVDFDEIDRIQKSDFSKRTDLNRLVKEELALSQGVDGTKIVTEVLIDETLLVAALDDAGQSNTEIEKRRERRLAAKDDLDSSRLQLKDIQKDAAIEAKLILDDAKQRSEMILTKAAAKAETLTAHVNDIQSRLDNAGPLPELINTAEIRQRIEAARKKNEAVTMTASLLRHAQAAMAYETQAKALTDIMEKRETEKQKAIAAASLPVKGITFIDGAILMNEVPFDQASDAEQLRASIAIAMALNPKLRVIRVRDGSLLDQDSMKLLKEMADNRDYQVWIERVDTSGKVGFIIEDGHVRQNDDGKDDKSTSSPRRKK